MTERIVGIDLGTTNSEIAVVNNGEASVLAFEDERIMPSVVGVDDAGQLLVGTPALNQFAAWPERTVASIKRLMGTHESVRLGDRDLAPEEVSALILKELVRRAEILTGERPEKAVITVPAFFRDAQRQATRHAGVIAGLDVLRIVNEPTAAALAYGSEDDEERLILVYDLGGGTFDVSVVLTDGTMTEVLASHGDVKLGGDDFDRLLADDLADRLVEDGHPDPRRAAASDARLLEAARSARHRLSEEMETRVREEFLVHDARKGATHLDLEVTRERLEQLISPLVERTLDSVDAALKAADRRTRDLDGVLLVGGATRTPLVGQRLEEVTGQKPRLGLDPDLSVALGAAVLGARLGGADVSRVLVDVTPYSFGPRHAGDLDGEFSYDCFTPIIRQNTPLPVTRSSLYYTLYEEQEAVDVRIFQGESENARENILVGSFLVEGLSKVPANSEIVCKMSLGLDGLLTVEAIERCTGLSKKVTIQGATAPMDPDSLEDARRRTSALWEGTSADDQAREESPPPEDQEPSEPAWQHDALELLTRARKIPDTVDPGDKDDLHVLQVRLGQAVEKSDESAAASAMSEMDDLLYYLEQV